MKNASLIQSQANKSALPSTNQERTLQRTCACGQHTIGGSQCSSCKSSGLSRQGDTPGVKSEVTRKPDLSAEGNFAESRFAQDLSHVPARSASSTGGGQAIPQSLRSRFEDRFQSPLASVRIHDDFGAARMAKQNRANAMTVGENIYFGKGRYRPHDSQGQRLLTHELTHVIQQRNPGFASSVSASEGEAHDMAEKSLSGARLPQVRHHAVATHSAPMLDKSKAREVIEDELDDVFCNIKNAWQPIREAEQSERDEIRADKVIERNIQRRSSDMELLKTYLLLTYGAEENFPAHYQAFIEATDMVGTHEARINAILRGVTEPERKEMQDMPGLVEVIEDETSGSERQEALRLLYEGEKTSGVSQSSKRTSIRLERNERYSLESLARASFETAQYRIQRVSESADTILKDTSLWAQFADQFAIEEVWYLRMLARYDKEANFPTADKQTEPFVKIIWGAVEPVGTDEEKLIKVLEDVNNSTTLKGGGSMPLRATPRDELKADPWFVPMLESELSGKDLKRALKAVSATASTEVAIRDALENAIDKRDMQRIRELLTDPKLSKADRKTLRDDPVILDEMGEELNAIQLCEISELIVYGSVTGMIADLLAFFQQKPIDVAGAVAYLTGLSEIEQDILRRQPGVHYMLSDVKGDYLKPEDSAKLLAAIRSHETAWQEKGSEGTHYTVKEEMETELPASITGTEARIQVRLSIDTSLVPKVDNKPFKVSSDVIEDWTRAIDEVWNNKFRLRSGDKRLSLVFDPYIAPNISPPNVPLIVENTVGRSRAWYKKVHLYLKGLPGEDKLPPVTVAHEFGHVVGNPDEYNLTPQSHREFTGTEGTKPRGGQTVKGLMGNQKEDTTIAKRHVEPVVEIVNAVRDTNVYPKPFSIEKA